MKDYTYSGPVDSAGLPHGRGKATLENGDTYTGEFNHGVFEGQATYRYKQNGDTFVGIFKANQFYSGTYTSKETGLCLPFKNGVRGEWFSK